MKQADKRNLTIAATIIIVIAIIFGKGNEISVNLNLNAKFCNEINNLPKINARKSKKQKNDKSNKCAF